jgi:hypothetical protein
LETTEEKAEAKVMAKARNVRRKSHGPRYKLKRTPKHYVQRRADGTFKKFTSIKRGQAQDRVWKAPKTKRSGFGHRKDKW